MRVSWAAAVFVAIAPWSSAGEYPDPMKQIFPAEGRPFTYKTLFPKHEDYVYDGAKDNEEVFKQLAAWAETGEHGIKKYERNGKFVGYYIAHATGDPSGNTSHSEKGTIKVHIKKELINGELLFSTFEESAQTNQPKFLSTMIKDLPYPGFRDFFMGMRAGDLFEVFVPKENVQGNDVEGMARKDSAVIALLYMAKPSQKATPMERVFKKKGPDFTYTAIYPDAENITITDPQNTETFLAAVAAAEKEGKFGLKKLHNGTHTLAYYIQREKGGNDLIPEDGVSMTVESKQQYFNGGKRHDSNTFYRKKPRKVKAGQIPAYGPAILIANMAEGDMIELITVPPFSFATQVDIQFASVAEIVYCRKIHGKTRQRRPDWDQNIEVKEAAKTVLRTREL